jgi:hypothetical protein
MMRSARAVMLLAGLATLAGACESNERGRGDSVADESGSAIDSATAMSADTVRGASPRSARGIMIPPDQSASPRGGSTPRDPAPPASSPGRESMRGVVRVVGSEPLTQVVLRDAAGSERRLTGPMLAALRRVSGVEVSVIGREAERGALQVDSFTVRAVDGEPAIDGTVAIEGNDVFIVTATGRVRLGNPPSELREIPGARVWVSGPAATGPHVYGIIQR